MPNKFDTIIIGAGPGGYELASHLTEQGESVAIIERDLSGGTCLNRGCIPTKALFASAGACAAAQSASDLGVDVGEIKPDFTRITARVKDVVNNLREGVERQLSKCTFIHGEARFVGEHEINVEDEVIEADRIVIATGSAPARLNIPGGDLAITSDEALWMETLPQSITIIGGGVIGMEFAGIFAELGVKVTVIEFCKEILPTVEAEIGKRLRQIMTRRGVDILTGTSVTAISRNGNDLTVSYSNKKGEGSVNCDCVITAVGRRPVVPAGFTDYGGRLTSRGAIETDEYMRTSIPGVYAVGDVNGRLMLAHAAYAQGRVVLHKNKDLFNPLLVPGVVFTNPEIATVGHTSDSLSEAGIVCGSVKRPFASNGKACADGHTDGFVKILFDADDHTVKGISIIGHHAAELIAEATMLVTDGIKLEDIGTRYIHAHPTLSEIFA